MIRRKTRRARHGVARVEPHQPPDFTHLPARVPLADTVTSLDVEPAPDPQGGRDTETEFMLRNAGL